MSRFLGQRRHEIERGLQQPVHRRLADDAETDAGEGDAELGRRQVGVEMIDHPLRHAAPERVDVGSDLGRSDLDQRELGGDEETVQADQEDRERQPPAEGDVETDGRPGRRQDTRHHPRSAQGAAGGRSREDDESGRGEPRWSESGSGSSRLEPDGEGSEASSFTREEPSS